MENELLPFRLDAKMLVVQNTQRIQFHGEDKVLTDYLKLSGFVRLEVLVPVLGVERVSDAEGTLWVTEDRDLSLPNIAFLKPHQETRFENLDADINGIQAKGCTASKFSIEAMSGGGVLTLQLTVPHPAHEVVGRLSDLLGETVPVRIEPAQGDLDFAGGEEAS